MNITLADGLEVTEPGEFAFAGAEGWWIEDNRVTVVGKTSVSTYSLPRRARRVVLHRMGDGRSQLVIGGFTKVTVTVTGPNVAISNLREAVL